jgi:hydroxyacylglutathione hydrolase
MNIQPISAFDDNYIWLLQENGLAAVVDPGDADPVLEQLEHQGLKLVSVLITHKHGDHCGGVAELKEAFPELQVYGPAAEAIKGLTQPLNPGDQVEPLPGQVFQVLDFAGHTEGHLGYYQPGRLFCGDTLFSIGCGRVFSGTHAQLASALHRIATLPEDTLCYPAHEYTLANIGFAKWVEPENQALLYYEAEVKGLRANNQPSLPSSLQLELLANPFLRTAVPAVVHAAERWAGKPLVNHIEVFTALRTWKDRDYD